MLSIFAEAKLALICASLIFAPPSPPQDQGLGAVQGTPWMGMKGVVETVEEIMDRELAIPPDLRTPRKPKERDGERPDQDRLVNPLSPDVSQWPPAPRTGASSFPGRSGTGRHNNPPFLPQTIGTEWTPIDVNQSGFLPPDTQIAVGPTQVLVAANGRIKVYSKSGVVGGLNTGLDNFFASQSPTGGTSDPQISYDRTSGRFFVCAIDLASSNNKILLAVSSSSTITSQGSFTFFSFQQNVPAPAGNSGQFADYPQMGVDANAVIVGANMFNGTFQTSAWCIRKSSMISGGPIVVTAFRGLVVGAGQGPYAPRGVDNTVASATESYIIGVDNATFGTLVMRRITNPGTAPAISGNLLVTVPSTVFPLPNGSPAQGSTQGLSAIDDRLFDATIHRNKITGAISLWTAHNIQTTNAGVASNSGGRNSSRWYELGNLTGTPSLTQSGTLFSNAATPDNYFIPTVMMSGQGHMALGCTVSATNRFASVACAGRLFNDPLGQTQAATIAESGTAAYNIGSQNGQYRWGDYSGVAVDPQDDMTLWTAQEYTLGANIWAIRVVKLIAPGPAMPVSCSPSSLPQGATNQNVVVTGTSSSGTGFFDPDPAWADHIAAAFSGTGITVNSIVFNSPTQITVNVNVSGAATAGSRNLTVTNPDGQQATGSNVMTITSGSNPVPTITSILPQHKMAGDPTFTLTVNGTNFVSGGVSVVNWNGSARSTTYVSATQLTAQIPNTDIGNSGTFNVTVVNSAPGGGTSNAVAFVVNPVQPTSYTTLIGAGSGATSALFFSDNVYVTVIGDESNSTPGIEIVTTAPLSTASQIQFVAETKASRTDAQIKLVLFNYSGPGYNDPSATWFSPATLTDSTQTRTIIVGASNFIQAGTLQMKAQLSMIPTSDTDVFDGWSIGIDRGHWIFIP